MSMKNTLIASTAVLLLLLLIFFIPTRETFSKTTQVSPMTLPSSNTMQEPSAIIKPDIAAIKPLPPAAKSTADITPTQIKKIESQAPNLSPTALTAALKPYEEARAAGLDQQQILTIVDFSKPSTQNRFYVIDFKHLKVLYATLVAHGENSGESYARRFSNVMGSEESSLGLYLTENSYWGRRDGYDLRLHGLMPGYNTNAERRAVIVHGASYVNPSLAAEGRLGRSWGCFSLEKNQSSSVINTIKGGTLIFAYAPISSFLRNTTKLNLAVTH